MNASTIETATGAGRDAGAARPRGFRAPAVPVWTSAAMRAVLESVEDVAAASTTVLLLGESGTGKEVLARLIHQRSARAAAPYVAVNCAALPGELLESELFGHERGAFTGASERRIGKVEAADGGTLLLDEISEMPLLLQAKLLRVLQEREVDRVGGSRPLPVDVRVIATSNRDLEEMVRARLFRADLYYRLAVFPIQVPPLRERPEDVPLLAVHFLARFADVMGRPVPMLTPAAAEALARYPFPGNVRELANLIERALVRCRGGVIDVAQLPAVVLAPPPAPERTSLAVPASLPLPPSESAVEAPLAVMVPSPTSSPPSSASPLAAAAGPLPAGVPLDLGALERLAIEAALQRTRGNRTHAARVLGISLRTLRNKLRALREQGASWASLDKEAA
jgi:two-component system response regulator FlrC